VLAPELFHDNFCADLPEAQAARMAVTQRPATQEALTEPSGDDPLWKQVPSWFVLGAEDRNLPPDLHRFLAERAGARRTIEVPGASHALSVSQPEATAEVILEATTAPVTA
jgi:pimeloyl-ACP methyl ester carboxylesterase